MSKLSDVLESVVKDSKTIKKPTRISGTKVATTKPSNAIKIEDMNE